MLDAFVTGDVSKRGGWLVCRVGLGSAAANRHHVAHLASSTTLHPDQEADDQSERQQQRNETRPPVARWLLVVVGDAALVEPSEDAIGDLCVGRGGELHGRCGADGVEFAADAAAAVVDGDLLHGAVIDLGQELAPLELL